MFKSIRHHIRNLEAGAQLVVPAGEVNGSTIRNYAYYAAADFNGRKYKVAFDKEARTYTVTRIA